jgi:hypothetical protein
MCIRKSRVVVPRYPLFTTHQPLFFALCFHTLTNCHSRKSFLLITIRVARGCGDLCALSRHSSLATRHFPKVWGLLAGSVSLRDSAYPLWPVSPFVSCSCGLFGIPKKVNSFAIKQIQTLLAKHPGWGVSPSRMHHGTDSRFPGSLFLGALRASVADRIPAASLRAGRSGRRGLRRRGAARGPRRCSLCGGGRSAARKRSRGAAR